MNNHYPSWPNIRKSLFQMKGESTDSKTKCFINHIGMCGFDYDCMSRQYKDAADALISHVEAGELGKHPEAVFFPIAYMYRHSLELKLKSLLTVMSKRNLFELPDLTKHKLIPLWELMLDAWGRG